MTSTMSRITIETLNSNIVVERNSGDVDTFSEQEWCYRNLVFLGDFANVGTVGRFSLIFQPWPRWAIFNKNECIPASLAAFHRG